MSQLVTQEPSQAPGTIYKVERTDPDGDQDYGSITEFVSIAHTPLILEEQINQEFLVASAATNVACDINGVPITRNDLKVTVLGVALPTLPSGVVIRAPIE